MNARLIEADADDDPDSDLYRKLCLLLVDKICKHLRSKRWRQNADKDKDKDKPKKKTLEEKREAK